MIFHILSDTHGQHSHFEMPGGDFAIHCGDFSTQGKFRDIMNFISWFQSLNYTHKILIPGNHDLDLENNFAYWKDECEKRNIHLLNDSGIVLENIRFWGSASTPFFRNWAFNRQPGADIERYWSLIPEETEILITHGPPQGILDMTKAGDLIGCPSLLKKILKTNIKIHLFGHNHHGKGWSLQQDILFVNNAVLTERYTRYNNQPTKVKRSDTGIYFIEN